ncbi:unnamed protein product [Amoebophrya sp. A120]|nr:unnamed protein product [Amoebophrya sp. A120]|eukprot:GSA120T00019965001.1
MAKLRGTTFSSLTPAAGNGKHIIGDDEIFSYPPVLLGGTAIRNVATSDSSTAASTGTSTRSKMPAGGVLGAGSTSTSSSVLKNGASGATGNTNKRQHLDPLDPQVAAEIPSFGEWFDWQEDADILADNVGDETSKKSDLPDSVMKEIMLSWRLRKPYLIYCCILGVASFALLLLTAYSNMSRSTQQGGGAGAGTGTTVSAVEQQQHQSSTSSNIKLQPHYHWALELAEIIIGLCLVVETLVTWYTLGNRAFFASRWCRFDFAVSLGTTWIVLLESWDRFDFIEEYFEMPILILRFGLQPLRLIQTAHIIRKARQMQITQNSTRIFWEKLPTEEPHFSSSTSSSSAMHSASSGMNNNKTLFRGMIGAKFFSSAGDASYEYEQVVPGNSSGRHAPSDVEPDGTGRSLFSATSASSAGQHKNNYHRGQQHLFSDHHDITRSASSSKDSLSTHQSHVGKIVELQEVVVSSASTPPTVGPASSSKGGFFLGSSSSSAGATSTARNNNAKVEHYSFSGPGPFLSGGIEHQDLLGAGSASSPVQAEQDDGQHCSFRAFLPALIEFLPLTLRFAEWRLLFKPQVHGFSHFRFLKLLEEHDGAVVLLVRDSQGCVFGAFTERLKPHSEHRELSFVFTFGKQDTSLASPPGSTSSTNSRVSSGRRQQHAHLSIEIEDDSGDTTGATSSSRPPAATVASDSFHTTAPALPGSPQFVAASLLKTNKNFSPGTSTSFLPGDHQNAAFAPRIRVGFYNSVPDLTSSASQNRVVGRSTSKGNELPAVLFEESLLCFGEALILQIDHLLRGASKPCAAYGLSEALTATQDFVIQDLELWRFEN